MLRSVLVVQATSDAAIYPAGAMVARVPSKHKAEGSSPSSGGQPHHDPFLLFVFLLCSLSYLPFAVGGVGVVLLSTCRG